MESENSLSGSRFARITIALENIGLDLMPGSVRLEASESGRLLSVGRLPSCGDAGKKCGATEGVTMSSDPFEWPVFAPTSLDELSDLALFLRSHPNAYAIISRAGIHGDFTEDDEKFLSSLIEAYIRSNLKVARDPLLLQLSVTLCRWIADGRIDDATGQRARLFLHDRFFDRSGGRYAIVTKKAWPEEVIWVAKALKADPIYWAAMESAGEMEEVYHQYAREVLRPIRERVRLKYGLMNRARFDVNALLRRVVEGRIGSLDEPEAIDFVLKDSLFVKDIDSSVSVFL